MIEIDVARTASLIGDPARARMLVALMSGKALTASELALEADITPQTASTHLAKLVKSQFLVERKQGRHKYFQLSNAQVAELIEQLLNISVAMSTNKVVTGPKDVDLKKARICYDHLAGELGVMLYDSLVENEFLTDSIETTLTGEGLVFFDRIGANVKALKNRKRPLCKSCLDWSERRSHLAGSLGKWILEDVIAKKWATQDLNSRAIRFSKTGLSYFKKRYRIVS